MYEVGGVTEQLKFGEITRAEAEKQAGIAHQENPCVAAYGRDPMGRSCKFCANLKRYGRYMKCALRHNTASAATDHRANWPACGKYERAL